MSDPADAPEAKQRAALVDIKGKVQNAMAGYANLHSKHLPKIVVGPAPRRWLFFLLCDEGHTTPGKACYGRIARKYNRLQGAGMYRNLHLALLTASAAFALMAIPPLLPVPMTAGLSAHALEAVTVKSNRSKGESNRLANAGKSKSNDPQRSVKGKQNNPGATNGLNLNSSRSNIY